MNYKRSKYFTTSNKKKIKYFFLNKNSEITVVFFHGFIHFNTPFTASTQRTWTGTFVTYDDADEQRAFSGGGRVVNGTQMTGFGFSCSSGDFSKFTGRVYGVVDS